VSLWSCSQGLVVIWARSCASNLQGLAHIRRPPCMCACMRICLPLLVLDACQGNANVDAAFELVHELVSLNVPDIATVHKLQEFTGGQGEAGLGLGGRKSHGVQGHGAMGCWRWGPRCGEKQRVQPFWATAVKPRSPNGAVQRKDMAELDALSLSSTPCQHPLPPLPRSRSPRRHLPGRGGLQQGRRPPGRRPRGQPAVRPVGGTRQAHGAHQVRDVAGDDESGVAPVLFICRLVHLEISGWKRGACDGSVVPTGGASQPRPSAPAYPRSRPIFNPPPPSRSSKSTYRRLFIFTCNEDPTSGISKNRCAAGQSRPGWACHPPPTLQAQHACRAAPQEAGSPLLWPPCLPWTGSTLEELTIPLVPKPPKPQPPPPPSKRELLDQRLDDLHHQRTWLDVFPLLALERPFDMTLFWNHAIQVGGWRGGKRGRGSRSGNSQSPGYLPPSLPP
jgi:hypothetical protein